MEPLGVRADRPMTCVTLSTVPDQPPVDLSRRARRPLFRRWDRILSAAASRVLPRSRWKAFVVSPRSFVRWDRELVRRKWTYRRRAGRRPCRSSRRRGACTESRCSAACPRRHRAAKRSVRLIEETGCRSARWGRKGGTELIHFDMRRFALLLWDHPCALMGANQGPAMVRGQILTPAPIDRLLLPHRARFETRS